MVNSLSKRFKISFGTYLHSWVSRYRIEYLTSCITHASVGRISPINTLLTLVNPCLTSVKHVDTQTQSFQIILINRKQFTSTRSWCYWSYWGRTHLMGIAAFLFSSHSKIAFATRSGNPPLQLRRGLLRILLFWSRTRDSKGQKGQKLYQALYVILTFFRTKGRIKAASKGE